MIDQIQMIPNGSHSSAPQRTGQRKYEIKIITQQRARGSYLDSLINNEGCTGKEDLRRIIRSFIQENTRGDIRILTLPGPQWIFENDLDKEMHAAGRRVRFNAFEYREKIWRAAKLRMPGTYCRLETATMRKSADLQYLVSENARLFLADVTTAAMLTSKLYTRKARHPLTEGRKNDAIWLDTMSTLTPATARMLRNLTQLCADSGPDIPVALTFLAARDVFTDDRARVNGVVEEITAQHVRFEHMLTHRYISHTQSPMLTVMGIIHKTTKSLA